TTTNQPDHNKATNPSKSAKETKTKKPDAESKEVASTKKSKRTASLRSLTQPFQDKKRPHPSKLSARIIETDFNPEEDALNLLNNPGKTIPPTLPQPYKADEGKRTRRKVSM
ncbi:hypothetical protein PTTG_31020, partial [Puccinia triticina 1-1 BBBD Race 1]